MKRIALAVLLLAGGAGVALAQGSSSGSSGSSSGTSTSPGTSTTPGTSGSGRMPNGIAPGYAPGQSMQNPGSQVAPGGASVFEPGQQGTTGMSPGGGSSGSSDSTGNPNGTSPNSTGGVPTIATPPRSN